MLRSVDWADLNRDSAKWQVVENTVMTCRGILNRGGLVNLRSYLLLKKKLCATLLIILLVCMFASCVRIKS